jgi:prepilin-type N-terminal cleavage/methylation domain-containing protein
MRRIHHRNHHARGFTLLEVIVALAITGFILGSLFTLVAGSKQVTWRAEDNLLRATQIRAATNFALLQNEYTEVEEILENRDYQIEALERLEPPLRKTQPSNTALQEYQIVNSERDERYTASRWIQLYVRE